MFGGSCVGVADRLAQVRCGTAATLGGINHTRSWGFGNFVFEGEEMRRAWGRAKHESDIKMGMGGGAETGDLGANLGRMFARMRRREVRDFFGNRLNTGFGLRHFVWGCSCA